MIDSRSIKRYSDNTIPLVADDLAIAHKRSVNTSDSVKENVADSILQEPSTAASQFTSLNTTGLNEIEETNGALDKTALVISFTLESSQYATMAMREIMKV